MVGRKISRKPHFSATMSLPTGFEPAVQTRQSHSSAQPEIRNPRAEIRSKSDLRTRNPNPGHSRADSLASIQPPKGFCLVRIEAILDAIPLGRSESRFPGERARERVPSDFRFQISDFKSRISDFGFHLARTISFDCPSRTLPELYRTARVVCDKDPGMLAGCGTVLRM
jgi:hypothetical protein